jgi:putative Mg2+ transporter-C (MgtC) family protein
MLELINDYYVLSSLFRLALALLCGGILGIERGRKKRPAGFRTYMLVCMGSALVMMTNEYINNVYGTGDVARMGAQVINGIGFLGAGTIIFTGHNKVKGLTTAAGLWASACIGLAVGIGFYVGAIIGTGMIFFAMALLHNLDDFVISSSKAINLYIELDKTSDMKTVFKQLKSHSISITDLDVKRAGIVNDLGPALLINLRLPKKQSHTEVLDTLSSLEGVLYLEEL